jgi:tetratricopeptide (TPR) repeat protein
MENQGTNNVKVTNEAGLDNNVIGLAEKMFMEGENILRSNGDMQKAAALFLQVTNIAPYYSDAYSNLGIALFRLKKFDSAIKCFEAANKLDPENKIKILNYCKALTVLNCRNEAFKLYDEYLKKHPNDIEVKELWYTLKLNGNNIDLNSIDNNANYWKNMREKGYFEKHIYYGN